MKNTLIIAGLMTATLAMAQPQPISYSNLVKTGTKLAEGVLPIYQHDNRVYMEFDRQLISLSITTVYWIPTAR